MKYLTFAFGAVALLLFGLLLALPISGEAQLAFALPALAVMVLIDRLNLGGVARPIFLTLGFALIARYIVWRATSTLPPTSDTLNFLASAVVFAAELFCFATFTLGLFAVLRPIQRPRAPQLTAAASPTVDVFVPSYNEPVAIVASTLAAAKAMTYPQDKLTVHLLDDGATDERLNSADPEVSAAAEERRQQLIAVCDDLGVVYHTREANTQAKAGNLNAGLASTGGELVVVFDADHAPTRDFLQETVGFFRGDDRLFLVQTPHFFLNPDPLERNLRTFERMPSENEMFYNVIQRGLDNWNAAFFCGSAAVLRREALEEVGGFSGLSITEDCETALDLHARGWNSLYVDKPMVAGLQPETFAGFIGQRSRWCRGMIQILLLKNPLFKRGLSLAQRLCYLSSCLFWLFPLPRMVFLFAPLLFVFFNMQIYNATVEELFSYTAVYIAALLLIQANLFGRVRWPLISELYEYIQSVYLFRAVIGVFANPRAPTFNVTAKGASIGRDRLSELAMPYYALFGVLATTMGVIVWRFIEEPEIRNIIIVIGIWNLLNLVIAGLALGVVIERGERRQLPRVEGKALKAALALGDDVGPAVITDVSAGGIRVRTNATLSNTRNRDGVVRVALGDGSSGKGEVTVPVRLAFAGRDDKGRVLGLAFTDDGRDRYQLIAALQFGDIGKIEEKRIGRRRRRFMPLALIRLTVLSTVHALRGLAFAVFRRGAEKRPAGGKAAG
jgi:cellulose synthase (UDP-forming)